MKSICYVIPYFGTLPKTNFKLWLISCAANPTVNWLIYTDDKTKYDFPENVKVKYCSFDEIRQRFQANFDFKISLDRGYKLCDFRPAYGEVFAEDLKDFDFWGYCDIDLMFGNIRKYYTDEVLEKFEKVAFFGHSALYKNDPVVNSRYRAIIPNKMNYIEAMSQDKSFAFDEIGVEEIYKALEIPYFKEINFANLTKYEWKFHLDQMPEDEEYKNRRQIFTWQNGELLRHYLYKGEIFTEEYLYIHFWCRPMTYKVETFDKNHKYLIYSDVMKDTPFEVTKNLIRIKGISHPIRFYAKSIWKNRHKLTMERIIFNIKGTLGLND